MFDPAVAYYTCLNLLAAFTQPGASTLTDLCTSAVRVDSVSCVACKVALYFRRAEGKACGAPKALPMYETRWLIV